MSSTPDDELVCVDDTHYIHVGDNPATGKPCNSSVSPNSMQGLEGRGWTCLGCNRWWSRMPEMPELGLAALAHLKREE